MNKTLKKFFIILIFFILVIDIGTLTSEASELYLNSLDFQTQINSDGSIDITETWNIDIEDTNTLYKVFETDLSKYSEITNVVVKDITSGENKILNKTDEWAYHVEKDYYYGTENEDGDFEIGWGVGLDYESAVRKYQISYTVKDVIKKATDYSELYWQFVGEDFEIDANIITGTIYLPENVSNKEEIKVWGHTEDLNGVIYVTGLNKIEFEINNFNSGRFVEIRTLFPTELINYSGRTANTDILQSVIDEETEWANEANARRERNAFLIKMVAIVAIVLNVVLTIIFLIKTAKYVKKYKEIKKPNPTTKLEYFREMPNENTTPGEAYRIIEKNIQQFTPSNFGKVFSATLLNLTLKGYIEITQDLKNKKQINIKILEINDEKLKLDEKDIFGIVKDAAAKKEVFTLKDLEKYIEKHPSKIEKLFSSTFKNVETQLINEKIIDEEGYKEYKKYRNKRDYYILAAIFVPIFTAMFLICPVIIFIVNAIICNMIAGKLEILTQEGLEQKEQWKGLKNYMENFSLLNEREVPELVIWEKYLVFATVFGIADKVIKQLKIVYPNFDEMITVGNYTYVNLMANTNFSATFTNAITSSISTAYSSGTGSGGGFSGGGRWRRRPEVAVEVDNTSIKHKI